MKTSVIHENVLGDNIGYVELLEHMGDDLTVVNAARASYGRESAVLGEREQKLIAYLGANHHTAPLRHVVFRLRVKAPEFVARQWYKHVVGGEYAFKDNPWSEYSQRFLEAKPEFYVPTSWYTQGVEDKQASGMLLPERVRYSKLVELSYRDVWHDYQTLIDAGVAREQARIVLPLGIYTEWVWTVGIQALVHFCVLRKDPHAQKEIQAYALAVEALCGTVAPLAWKALEDNHAAAQR